jgi:hypothetical protein
MEEFKKMKFSDVEDYFRQFAERVVKLQEEEDPRGYDYHAILHHVLFLLFFIDKLKAEKGHLIALAELCSQLPKLEAGELQQLLIAREKGKQALEIAKQSDTGYIEPQPYRNAIVVDFVGKKEDGREEWLFSFECKDESLKDFLRNATHNLMLLTNMEVPNADTSRPGETGSKPN